MKLIGYTRVSDKEQVKKGYSIEAQQETLEAWCLEQNHHLVDIYVEPGRSSSKPAAETRPTFERAIAYILAGAADGLVVKWMDRFARNVEDFLRVRSQFFQAGKQLISVSEPLLNGDPSDPIARFIATAIMNAYQLQAELSGLKAAQGRDRRARQGKYPGPLPLGYVREEREIKIEPTQSQFVMTAFYEFSTGQWTLDSWTEEARRRGYKSRRGGNIHKSVWQRTFRHPLYVGRYKWKGEEYEGDHPTFIDEQTFNQVQELLDSSGPGPDLKRHFWLLAGLLWSEPHHKLMTGTQIKGGRFNYYRAATKGRPEHNVPAEELEARVIDMLDQVTWTGDGNIYRIPDDQRLAVQTVATMGQIYPFLNTNFEKRNFLRLIFLKKGISVAASGVVTELRTFPGFTVQIPSLPSMKM